MIKNSINLDLIKQVDTNFASNIVTNIVGKPGTKLINENAIILKR